MSFFKKIFGVHPDTADSQNSSDYNVSEKSILPVDEFFTHNFKKNGGKFIYCDNLNEVKEQFENILEENDWFESEANCYEPKLFPILEENKLKFDTVSNPKFLFASCESLIADEGAILFSSNQIKHFKPNELLTNIVVLATTSQIALSKGDSLQAIRKRYTSNYPTNITAIKYFDKVEDEDFLTYGSSPKNLYLLLLEDL
jgi:hypothetical protein